MKIDSSKNYCILSNNITDSLVNKIEGINVIGDLSFDELWEKLEFFPSKQVIFKETWYNLREIEIKKIIELLDKQNIKYINVTSNVEEAIYADYIMVYDNNLLVLEGTKDAVLREEKTLKRLGFGLPFVVDLSIQLNYYDIFDKVYYDMDAMVSDIWN